MYYFHHPTHSHFKRKAPHILILTVGSGSKGTSQEERDTCTDFLTVIVLGFLASNSQNLTNLAVLVPGDVETLDLDRSPSKKVLSF